MSPYQDDGYGTWPGLVESVPEEFAALVTEPAFCDSVGADQFLAATVCVWRRHHDPGWQVGDIEFPAREDPDGAERLFQLLADGTLRPTAPMRPTTSRSPSTRPMSGSSSTTVH